jgi:hypothetical protein
MPDTVDEWNRKVELLKKQFQADFKARVRDRTPVRTGALQAGWVWDNSNPDLPVFTNLMNYAAYVENGTEFQRPQMMVAITLREAPQILNDAAKKVGL